MKKGALVLLCVLLFVACAAGIGAWFTLSPRGALRSDLPDEVMQEFFSGHSREEWKSEFIRLEAPAVTEFESAADVAGDMFEAAVGDNGFAFREEAVESPGTDACYIVSAGTADLLKVRLAYRDKAWSVTGTEPAGAVTAESYTADLTVPAGTELRINGVHVDERYIVDDAVPYESMTELERRFEGHPVRVRYEVPGLYRNISPAAERDGGALLLYSDGRSWSYTQPDEGAYTFRITVPQQAKLTVGGAELGAEESSAAIAYKTKLDIPGELQAGLPSYYVFTAGGLYRPDYPVTAIMPDGTVLEGIRDGDALVFTAPSSDALYAQCHERVETFIHALIEYGAGHTARYSPQNFTVPGSPVFWYIRNAISSLMFTVNVTLTFDDVQSFEYVPLGDSAFVCRAQANCHTSTYYQKKDLSLGYEMLWVLDNGVWLLQDLAFT